MEEAVALCDTFLQKAKNETGVVHYAIGVGQENNAIHTREGFDDAHALLFHANNVAAEFQELLTLADFVRADAIGPANELDELIEPLSGLDPVVSTPLIHK